MYTQNLAQPGMGGLLYMRGEHWVFAGQSVLYGARGSVGAQPDKNEVIRTPMPGCARF